MALEPVECKKKRQSGVCRTDDKQTGTDKEADVAVANTLRVHKLVLSILGRDVSLLGSR